MAWTIIGIDSATQEDRTGLCHAELSDEGVLTVKRVTLGTAGESAVATVAGWIEHAPKFLIALDAPLGWPASLGEVLHKHRAGAYIAEASDNLFRRETDRFVHKTLGKMPLEVGADRIARTAVAALRMVNGVHKRAGRKVPMAWKPGKDSGALEVYPAATLRAHGLSASGYKGKASTARKARAALLSHLRERMQLPVSGDLLTDDDNLLDAVVCALAGADFALGLCIPPADLETAKKEGWIWFRGTGQRELSYR